MMKFHQKFLLPIIPNPFRYVEINNKQVWHKEYGSELFRLSVPDPEIYVRFEPRGTYGRFFGYGDVQISNDAQNNQVFSVVRGRSLRNEIQRLKEQLKQEKAQNEKRFADLKRKFNNLTNLIVTIPGIFDRNKEYGFDFKYVSQLLLNNENRQHIIGGWVERGEILAWFRLNLGTEIHLKSPVSGRIINHALTDPLENPFAKIQLAKNEDVPPTAELAFANLRETIMKNPKKWETWFSENPTHHTLDKCTRELVEFKLVPRETTDDEKKKIHDLDNELVKQGFRSPSGDSA